VRILHTLASPAWSGPAEGVALLADAQRRLGHDVKVAIDRKRAHVTSEEASLPYFETMGLLDERNLELSVKSSARQVWHDVRTLRHFEVDIIHCHFSHDHTVTFFGCPSMAKVIRSIHAPRSLRWSTPRANGWTVPTEALSKQLAPAQCLVMPALVADSFKPHPDRAALRKELGVDGSPLIGMVSTFQPSRRHEVGIEAFARLKRQSPDARLVLIGDGRLEAVLRVGVLSRGITDAVTFPGYQQGPDFVRWLQAFDEVWVLGLGNDFSGRAAAQARACGVRVVAVDEGALPGIADELVPPDAEALVKASQSGTRRQIQVTSSEQIAASVIDLYDRVRPR
jgi:glycosyltransferase involved in cell wall biosynthesis